MPSFHARRIVPLVALVLASPALAQVDYRLSFEPGGEHWNVEARFVGRGAETLDFWIPRWTPGAYHPADFGRFVTELDAIDDQGAALAVERKEHGEFVVGGAAKAREVVIRYKAESISENTLSNGIIDVESNRIAQKYAYVNPASLFGFVPERVGEEVWLALDLPDGWEAATVLERDEAGRYRAPSYLRFEDSPLLFSPALERAEFTVDGKPHFVTVQGRDEEDVQLIADGCKRIVEAGAKLMQGLPYDRYHFLYGFVDEASGSGLEHSYSTLILVNRRTEVEGEAASGFWGITAHEFFHLWCAERIHVEEIHHPDLTRPIETGTIWVNESITEYLCRHLLLHAGFLTQEGLLRSYLDSHLPPGALPKHSFTDVSRATSEWQGMGDIGLFAMTMYVRGPTTVFALDLEMRRATGGERGVLDLLRHLDAEYARKDRGFGEEELDDILAQVGGPPALAFYERYIDGSENADPAVALDVIGYRYDSGELQPLQEPSEEQARARADFFSITGEP